MMPKYRAAFIEHGSDRIVDARGEAVTFERGVYVTILADDHEAALELAFMNAPDGHYFHSIELADAEAPGE